MPIYEYRCRSCGRIIEVMQRMNDRPMRKCGHCSGKLEKLISRSSFTLKGGGWSSEGYSKKGSRGRSAKGAKEPEPAKAGESSAA